eukprot:CAMPEP_0197233994 /NCGR_PEP_ID=MMETSP1429-20130617/1873_1 /TAXON_ID=49237 /ORGANISM="Chaetoceros  sp., Strain UNC1202" /LENGTH=65 /DNA_ID=CAMNT_0042692317 /DNA_START=157 /DNA_END=354 /DNA_ORIENTATION=+
MHLQIQDLLEKHFVPGEEEQKNESAKEEKKVEEPVKEEKKPEPMKEEKKEATENVAENSIDYESN